MIWQAIKVENGRMVVAASAGPAPSPPQSVRFFGQKRQFSPSLPVKTHQGFCNQSFKPFSALA
jgi:hypothetical protein